jgi:hypothetical protein
LPGVGLHANANRDANGDGHTCGAALPGIGLHADAGCHADGGAAERHTHVDADAHRHAAPCRCG